MSLITDLLALRQTPVAVVEAEEAHPMEANIDGLRAVVSDALADLNDKLGEGGALETMMDQLGVTHLDTVDDKEGLTIMGRLDLALKSFTEEVEHLLTEAEILLSTGMDKPAAE